MGKFFFREDFEFDRYIRERLLEIEDEEERKALKDVLKETLIPFYEYVEEAYGELQNRLIQSKHTKRARNEIITGICNRNFIDITEEDMVPMQYGDLNSFCVDIEELKERMMEGKSYTVMKVFLQADYKVLQEMEKERRNFKGTVYTEDGEYPGFFQIKRNQSYLKQIAELYPVFMRNNLNWNTVCAPYLYKFYDVDLIKTECPLDIEIKKITIDFQEYSQYINYDMIPTWNIRILEEKTSAYPDFAVDQIHYEHCIYRSRFQEDRDYLVMNEDQKIWNVFWEDGDMHIICREEKPVRWKLLELSYESKNKKYECPVFGNEQYGGKEVRCIHTYAEVKRFIESLGYTEYVQLSEIQMIDGKERKIVETYSMDQFIEDEIRLSNHRMQLLFLFQVQSRESYLIYDIMSYLISRIQWKLPEFECIGQLQ